MGAPDHAPVVRTGPVLVSSSPPPSAPAEAPISMSIAASDDNNSGNAAEERFDDEEDSPYEEVRAAVRNTDGGEMASTLRAYIIGFFFVTLGTGLHQFLSLRSPVISLPAIVVQLLAYPVGRLWARFVPSGILNPGPFTIKEHVVITLMSNVSIGGAYSTDALVAMQGKPFYNINLGWGFAILFTLSSQLIGIALSGLFRRFLVWPAAMVWPRQFASTSLFYALHDPQHRKRGDGSDGWRISRYRWFVMLAIASFSYTWIPSVLMRCLSVFSFITWIRPESRVLNQLFGGYTGLSLWPTFTLDWAYVTAYLGDPLLAPTDSHVNTLVGVFFFMIVTTIAIVYRGDLYADYLPLVTAQTYDNTQRYYNTSAILGSGLTFDKERYERYSPLFLPPALALNYGLSFAALTSAVVHIWLFHGDVWFRFRASRDQKPDVHLRMMGKYSDTPQWWYVSLLIGSLCLGLGTVLGYESQLPWWAFIISILLALVFIVPVTMVLAMSNIMLGLNILSPFIAGFLIPGRPIGVMMFNVYSTVVLLQAQTYSGDLKLAQYLKVPPKATFCCQVAATIWAVFVQIAVMNWTLGHVDGVCDNVQPDHFTCPNGRALFSSTVAWGVIGTRRMFGAGGLYSQLNWFWLVGAGLPVLLYFLTRVKRLRGLGHLQAPVMLGAMAWLPPGTPLSYTSWAFVGLIFNHLIRRRYRAWWLTYNYTTAAALDSGLVLATVVVFLAITFPGVQAPRWWGNTAVFETLDAKSAATLKTVPEGETFGPAKW